MATQTISVEVNYEPNARAPHTDGHRLTSIVVGGEIFTLHRGAPVPHGLAPAIVAAALAAAEE